MRKYLLILSVAALSALALSCGNGNQKKQGPGAEIPADSVVVVKEPLRGPDSLNAVAALFSGMPVDSASSFASYMDNAVWKSHASLIDGRWKLCKDGLDKVDAFAADSLSDIRARAKTVFYPFSGPDFAYAATLFPAADTVVMVALEPIGEPLKEVDLNKQAYLRCTPALSSLMNASYFITKSMAVDLGLGGLGGVTPVFEFFMTRLGYEILSIDKTAEDNLLTIRFFKKGEDHEKVLRYYRIDLSDGGLPEFFTDMVDRFDPASTVGMVKSCSYCMHYGNFTRIRDYMLAKTFAIVQDDTGVRYSYLNDGGFEVTLFGEYRHPLKCFAEMVNQPDLANAYILAPRRPVNFRFGYNHVPPFMVARKK